MYDNMSNGVFITPAEVKMSRDNKKKAERTVRQLPVYRDASNIFFVVCQCLVKTPMKYRKITEDLISLCSQLLITLSLAYDDKYNRVTRCEEALSFLRAIDVEKDILFRLGAMSKDNRNKIDRKIQSSSAQVAGWRNSAIATAPMK